MSTTSVDVHSHGGDHGGHEHDPHHQHHFTNMEQQFDTSKIGMWLFIVTEILLFGGLFVGFGMMQARYQAEFVEAHHHLIRLLGATNTVVLLFSSWTMVMAVHSARTNNIPKLKFFLFLTILCACIFLGVKYVEYSRDFAEGLYPAKWYDHHGDLHVGSRGYATFFSFYFMMTGLHGIHIVVGIVLLSWLYVKSGKGEYSSNYYTPVDLIGLYWHVVDMIWIYLFPLYYLIS
jgi:cytochrome c oxidase subunit III